MAKVGNDGVIYKI